MEIFFSSKTWSVKDDGLHEENHISLWTWSSRAPRSGASCPLDPASNNAKFSMRIHIHFLVCTTDGSKHHVQNEDHGSLEGNDLRKI